MRTLYAMPEGGGSPYALASALDAPKANEKGLGIHWTIHEFNGPRRKENISQINGFAIDVDKGPEDYPLDEIALAKGLVTEKEIMLRHLKTMLHPTWIVETKRGFHSYWLFKKPEEVLYSEELERKYRLVLKNRLIPYYNADPNASDLCRLLRAPNFFHRKDPQNPFFVRVVEENDCFYDWDSVLYHYPNAEEDRVLKEHKAVMKKLSPGDDLFTRVYNMDCEAALSRLSGHGAVNGECFDFKKTTGGCKNIFVDKKGTSCWVDREGRIGSLDKGGPTIWQWLFWYCRDHKEVYRTMQEVFPDVTQR